MSNGMNSVPWDQSFRSPSEALFGLIQLNGCILRLLHDKVDSYGMIMSNNVGLFLYSLWFAHIE